MTEDDKKKLKDSILEIDNSLVRIDGERDLIKTILEKVSEDLGIEKKVVRKMARVYHKSTFKEESELNSEFESFYNSLFGNDE